MKKSLLILALIAFASLHQAFAQSSPSPTPSASLYFRSNATGWNLDSASRLAPTAYEGVWEGRFEIRDPWMVDRGIDGVLTETSIPDTWNSGTKIYPVESSVLAAGTGRALESPIAATNGTQGYFALRFPSLGTYKLVVDTNARLVSLIAVTSLGYPQVGSGSYLYFRSNATSWAPDSRSILNESSTKGLFEVAFDVRETWMVNAGIEGVLTQTLEKNGWGTWSNAWGTVHPIVASGQTSQLKPAVAPDTENAVKFRLHFPQLGRYKLVVDWLNKTVAVAPSTPRPGETIWSLLGIGTMDAYGNVFTQANYRSGTFSRIDPDTGLPLWTVATGSETITSLYTHWSDGTSLVVSTSDRLSAYDILSGHRIWTTDLEGDLTSGTYFYASIFDGKTLFVNYGENSNKIAAVDRSTGKTLWTASKDESSYLYGFVAGRVLLFQYTPTSRIIALDASTGTTAWSFAASEYFYPLISSANDRLYVTGEYAFSRLDPQTGGVVWTRYTEPSSYATTDYGYLSVVRTGPFGALSRLDSGTGETVWTHAFDSEWGAYGSVLSNGSVFVQDGTRYSLIQGTSGNVLWSKTSETYLNFTFDAQQRLFLSNPYTLQRVDPNTGNALWTHVYDYANLPPSAYGLDYKGVSWIGATDSQSLFLTYQTSGYGRYKGQGIFSIDASTGALKWDLWDGLPLGILGQTATKLIYNSYYPYGESTTKSVLK